MDLRVSRSLDLLGDLKTKVNAYAQREEQLVRDFRSRRFAIERKHSEAIERIDAGLAQQAGSTTEQLDARAARVRALHDSRSQLIQRLRSTANRNVGKRVEEVRARWLGDLQMQRRQVEKHYNAELQTLGFAPGTTAETLAEQQSHLKNVEKRAKRALAGFGSLRNMVMKAGRGLTPDSPSVPAIQSDLATAEVEVEEVLRLPLARVFGSVPLPVILVVVAAACGASAFFMGLTPSALQIAGIIFGTVAIAAVLVHQIASNQVRPAAERIAESIGEARQMLAVLTAAAASGNEEDRQRVQAEFDRANAQIQEQWNRADDIASDFSTKLKDKLATQGPRLVEKNDRLLESKLTVIEEQKARLVGGLETDIGKRKQEIARAREQEMSALADEERKQWEDLEAGWKGEVIPAYQAIERLCSAPEAAFPDWSAGYVGQWKPVDRFDAATRFGHLDVDLAQGALPKDPRLEFPGPAQFSLPLTLAFPGQGSILIESQDTCSGAVKDALNNIVLRLLASTPPGKISFTILDPVGLGQNFAGLMHLADYEEAVINRRIWTQRDQIEERLAELNEHIEKVIQMYLRNEYETITEYNEQAGSVAEKYHFLVIADFPATFSETAIKRLQSITVSGPRCGVFTLIHWDRRQQMPDGFVPDELRQNSVCIQREKDGFMLAGAGGQMAFDAAPNDELAVELVHKIGKSSIDSNRVEVPFSQIAPKPDELWTHETTNELRIAIGRTGATKLQYLAIGKGTKQHALFAGKTGSGKSTLFHVIITNLSLACSPDQVEFYLIDFKKGVEFKCYATNRLPHARVVAIESDREFGLSVLQRVDEELKRRGDMFRKLGVQDIAGYKKAGGTEPVPRTLLIIDEFQEFYVEDDQIAQTASVLFDRIVRQGRAFGIHVLLGSQTLGGAYTLARTTLGQMVIRVALQCNEADAYLIMDENNAAPRLLSRPGEGIYNDAAGAVEGNSPFQVVWLSDDERDRCLHRVRDLADARHDKHAAPIVFEGNAPADTTENAPLARALENAPSKAPASGRCWLGAPNSIKGPTEAVFHRQSGNHLLIVGQRDESVLSLLGVSLISLAAQYPVGGARFIFLHAAPPDTAESAFLDRVFGAIPHGVTAVRAHEVADAMSELAAELKERSAGDSSASAPAVFVFIHGLHKFKKLRNEDDFSFSMDDSSSGGNPADQLTSLMTEGSSHGVHLIVSLDTYNNVGRFLSRKALSEFEMRVVFQMSANDSASLIDSPKAGNLGLHRALLYNEHEGSLETFRPYALPENAWLEQVAQQLASRAS